MALERKVMNIVFIFGIAGCLFSAAVMYVVLDYRRHGERQNALDEMLRVQAKVVAVQKKMQGYIQYLDSLSAAKQAVSDKLRSLSVKIMREQTHVEKIPRDTQDQRPEVTFVVHYSVEYTFGFDPKGEVFEVVGTTGGIELKIGRPVLMGVPLARPLSLVVAGSASLPNEEEVVRQIHGRLPAYAEQQGAVMASEPAIRALCEKKLMECVASFLAEQPGVTQVPIIHVVYK